MVPGASSVPSSGALADTRFPVGLPSVAPKGGVEARCSPGPSVSDRTRHCTDVEVLLATTRSTASPRRCPPGPG